MSCILVERIFYKYVIVVVIFGLQSRFQDMTVCVDKKAGTDLIRFRLALDACVKTGAMDVHEKSHACLVLLSELSQLELKNLV